MDFSNIEKSPLIQTITLKDADYKSTDDTKEVVSEVNLQYVKFQKVMSLSLFIESNLKNKETTIINQISIYGKSNKRIIKTEGVLGEEEREVESSKKQKKTIDLTDESTDDSSESKKKEK